MNKFESLKAHTRQVLNLCPNKSIFPPEPWSPDDLREIARIIKDFVDQDNEVLDEDNPWVTWLERWRFHENLLH